MLLNSAITLTLSAILQKRYRNSQPLIADDLLSYHAGNIVVSEQGRHVIRTICACFDRYTPSLLKNKTASFSKVI